MFTIKKVSRNGTEVFWETPEFSVDARYPDDSMRPADYPRFVNWDDRIMRFFPSTGGAETELVQIEDGEVYVMNATGKTVDRFRLGRHGIRPAQSLLDEIDHMPHPPRDRMPECSEIAG